METIGDFGDVRSACHARDLRALLDCYAHHHAGYVRDVLPEYEYEVWRWALTMCMHLITRTSLTIELARGFAATWAEWMCAGAVNEMAIYISAGFGSRRSYGYIAAASHDYWGDPASWQTTHELSIDVRHSPDGWCVKWGNGYD